MRSLLALVLVLVIGGSAYAGPFGIFGNKRGGGGSQGGCANGSCGAATQSASGSFSNYQYQLNAQPVVVAQPRVAVAQAAQVAQVRAARPVVAATMPEGVLITTDPPARPNKITFNGVEYFPRH